MERSTGSRARRFEVRGRAARCKEDSSGVLRVLRALTRKRAGVSYFDRHSFGDPSRKQDRKLLFSSGAEFREGPVEQEPPAAGLAP